MNQVHFRKSFNGTTLFIEAGDVFCECDIYNCKILIPDPTPQVGVDLGFLRGEEFEGTHFYNCHFMSMKYYLQHGGKKFNGADLRVQ